MNEDEAAIRNLVKTWLAATQRGDGATVLGLMTDDAVFLVPGRLPLSKASFAKAFADQSEGLRPGIEATSEIQEIQILGLWAYLWTRLSVVVTPPNGDAAVTRTGHTLSILKKEDGCWRISRDANLLTVVESKDR